MSEEDAAFEGVADMFESMTKQMKGHLRESFQKDSFVDSMKAFYYAVDWSEKWIWGILAFDLALVLAVVLTRRNGGLQAALFFATAGLIGLSERLNRVLGANWEMFSTQNYFDQHGIFLTTVLSGPLLFVLLLQVVIYVISCSRLLVEMKRKQIRSELRDRAKREKEGANGNGHAAEGQARAGASEGAGSGAGAGAGAPRRSGRNKKDT